MRHSISWYRRRKRQTLNRALLWKEQDREEFNSSGSVCYINHRGCRKYSKNSDELVTRNFCGACGRKKNDCKCTWTTWMAVPVAVQAQGSRCSGSIFHLILFKSLPYNPSERVENCVLCPVCNTREEDKEGRNHFVRGLDKKDVRDDWC